MPNFLVGDEQGHLKLLEHRHESFPDGKNYRLTTLSQRSAEQQKMVVNPDLGGTKAVISGYSDGTVTLSTFHGGDRTSVTTEEWRSTCFKPDSSYIGLASSKNNIYSCSSNGVLQLTTVSDPTSVTHQSTSLPTRLFDWKLSPEATTFAYGGDEVELSIWNMENAFQTRTDDPNCITAVSKKRKRNNELFPGEIWRAKNVANDFLGLRQPIRITSVDYLHTDSAHQIVTGTQFGDVRRYDTRAARRPVSDWKGIGKVGGVQVVKRGYSEHELFVSDHGTNLFSIDLRSGRVLYGYKGLSGAVTSIAPSPNLLVSTANDRFVRLHSTTPPPSREGQNLDHKGAVLEKIYVATVPTVVIWDETADTSKDVLSTEEQEDEVWNDMEQVSETDTEEIRRGKKRQHST